MNEDKLIRKYLHGELSSEEEQIFNNLMETDSLFADEVELQSVYYADRSSTLKAELQDLKPASKKSNKLMILGVLAAILLAIAYLFLKQTTTDHVHYAQAYLEEIHPAPSVLMSETDGDVLWLESIQLYNDKKYGQAIQSFTLAKEQRLHVQQSTLYIGLSHLYNSPRDFAQAVSSFQDLKTSNSLYSEEATWYMALAQLEQGNTNAGQKLLEEIITGRSWNHKKAQTLKESLHQ